MTNPAIRVAHLGKRYQIGGPQLRYKTIRESLVSLAKKPFTKSGNSDENHIWALKDVSFEVQPGEAVGVIGRNGAGKSTLLKVLAHITGPTEGRVEIRGRIGSLLEVGTGFHQELTGRENIYLNGAVLGMKRAEIDRKFDEIVDFAEIEQFLDTPTKHYSSGMYMRLAFAVAAHLEPEILLVDEVLAVGDAEFQKKCLGKMGEVAKGGRTVLFVSHNMAAIHNLCNKSMLLEKGEISVIGLTDQIIHHYATDSNHIPEKLIQVTQRKGNGKARFVDLLIKDESGRIVEQAVSGSSISIIMKYHSTVGLLKNCRISIAFYDNNGQVLFNCSSELTNKEVIILPPDGYIRCDIPKFPLSQGEYIISPFLESNREIIDWIIDGIKLDVIDGDFYGSGKLYPDGWQGKGVLVNHIWSCSNSI